MSSCCTLRLNRRSAFSSGSPSCKRTSAKGVPPPNLPERPRHHDTGSLSSPSSRGKPQVIEPLGFRGRNLGGEICFLNRNRHEDILTSAYRPVGSRARLHWLLRL